MENLGQLLYKLISYWNSSWDEHGDYYLNELLPNLIKNPGDAADFEKELCLKIKKIATKDELHNLRPIVQKIRKEIPKKYKLIQRIKAKLKVYDFKNAYSLFEFPGIVTQEEYEKIELPYKDEYEKSVLERIKENLGKFGFQEADTIFREYTKVAITKKIITEEEYASMKSKASEEYRFTKSKALINRIQELLNQNSYSEAKEIYLKNQSKIPIEEYEEAKKQYIKDYFYKNFGKKISEEQSLAVAKFDRNLLVKARAGSGKTSVIAWKTVFLINKDNICPDEIMILAFNRNARIEIKNRIRKNYKIESFQNARTFHSLAYQIVQPKQRPLFDEKEEFSRKLLSEFVQDTVRKIWNPVFKEDLYQYFRKELKEVERYGISLPRDEYFEFRRNLTYITIEGERVKSNGEKYIADFLCEHDIRYKYEGIIFWGKRNYKPDFSILEGNKDIVIEHWGIDENDRSRQVPEWWTQTWEEYRKEINAKRDFCKVKKITLIETSIADLKGGRESFEHILEAKLKQHGIECKKLSKEEIIKRIVEPSIVRITKMFVQFIQKAKMNEMLPEHVSRISKNILEDKVKIFLKLANKVYREYEKRLEDENKIDFYDLLTEAIRKINQTKGNCEIKDCKIKLKNLRWIMIDEYQDFSKLFFRLINSIRKYNKQINIFCVGDDWQAINSFAGSDLVYFENYKGYFENSDVIPLLTNYRSKSEIVEFSNKLMEGRGEPASFRPDNKGGEIITDDISQVRIECRNSEEYKKEKNSDEKFRFKSDDGFLKARYLKKCYEIIKENIGKKVKILFRTNEIYHTGLEEFENKLKRTFLFNELRQIGDFKKLINVKTIHRSKGLEADIIIIMQVCKDFFPLIHPNNQLYEIFGQTPKKVLEEERRLFYVAITRAKEKVYILTEEKENESDYLKE